MFGTIRSEKTYPLQLCVQCWPQHQRKIAAAGPTSRPVYIGIPNQLAQELHGSAGLLLAVAADAALLYSWPYGLPAATAQASYGT